MLAGKAAELSLSLFGSGFAVYFRTGVALIP
jgi:hypothetical protein